MLNDFFCTRFVFTYAAFVLTPSLNFRANTRNMSSLYLLLLTASVAGKQLSPPYSPRVEYMPSPALAISETKPRFSWIPKCDSCARGTRQVAFRITVNKVVAQTARGQAADTLVWDSGVVNSSQTYGIVYNGSALSAATTYQWGVQWLSSDSSMAMSAPTLSLFDVGLLTEADWSGAQV